MGFSMSLDNEGYENVTLEKVYRIADVLEYISEIPFLQKRLAFTGGTALNFVIFPKIERLSIDLDFDFRRLNSQKDWGKARDNVDIHIKQVLGDLGYDNSDIKIDPSYPLTRFIVKHDIRFSFNIEIGYMNRYPLFPNDEYWDFIHPKTGKVSKILLPRKEEIFSAKGITLLSRKFPRDLFDMAIIAKQDFDRQLLRKALLLKNMMNIKNNFTTLDISTHLRDIRADTNLMMVLGNQGVHYNFLELKKTAIAFLEQLQKEITENEKKCLSLFLEKQEFQLDLLGKKELFHPHINNHPNILRSLQKMKNS